VCATAGGAVMMEDGHGMRLLGDLELVTNER
jgi:hypothetical protein